jgi:surfeit locus 1 family protein
MQGNRSDRNADDARGTAVTGRMTRGNVLGTVLVLVIAVTCIRLGIWQLDRLAQRRTRNAELVARAALPPLSVPAAGRDSTGLINRRAVAHGVYDDRRSIILPGRSYRGSPGVVLLTPLLVADAPALLVQRGWIPSADAVSVDLRAFATDTAVTVSGVLRPFLGADNTLAVRAAQVAPADTFRRVWYAIDEERLRAQFPYSLLPFRLQLVPGPGAATAGYPLAQDPLAIDDGPHLGYAIQWFSFAVIFVVGWVILLVRGGSRSAIEPAGA